MITEELNFKGPANKIKLQWNFSITFPISEIKYKAGLFLDLTQRVLTNVAPLGSHYEGAGL